MRGRILIGFGVFCFLFFIILCLFMGSITAFCEEFSVNEMGAENFERQKEIFNKGLDIGYAIGGFWTKDKLEEYRLGTNAIFDEYINEYKRKVLCEKYGLSGSRCQ